MKILRVLIVLMFMFVVTATTTVQAAGPGVGYIRLLSQVSPGTPLRFQARRAYERMRPQLLALKASGAILSFQPELQAGFVKVQYAGSRPDMSAFGADQVVDSVRAAIVAPTQSRMRPAAPPPAGPTSFYMDLYSSCFFADGLPASAHVVGSLRDAANKLVASYEGDANSFGEITVDCFPDPAINTDVLPGTTVTFGGPDDPSFTTLLGTYSTVAPTFNFTSIVNAKSVVRGTGPATKPIEVDWFHENWNAGYTLTAMFKLGATSSAGTWVKDMSNTIPFRGGDELDVIIYHATNFAFRWTMDIPHIYCVLGTNFCEISGYAFKPATLSVTQGALTYSSSGKFDEDGYFSAEPVTAAGAPIVLKPGNKVSGTGVAQYTLPALNGTIGFYNDTVIGKVPPNRYFETWTTSLCGCTWYLVYSHSNGTGNFSADFSSQVDLVKLGGSTLRIYFQDLPTGNVTDYYRSFGP